MAPIYISLLLVIYKWEQWKAIHTYMLAHDDHIHRYWVGWAWGICQKINVD